MKAIYVSLPTAISAPMKLYITYILTSLSPDCFILAGAFFLSLGVYSFDRMEDYGKSLLLALFT